MLDESQRYTFLDNPTHIQLIDGRTLVTYTWGSGTDVVLFEAGGAASGAYWGLVVEALSKLNPYVRVIVYNRAGYGASTLAWDQRNLQDLVSDLLELIALLSFRRIVLVGHSWGGPIVRLAACSLKPSCLAGLVLVDATDELCDDYYREKGQQFYWNSWKMVPRALTGALARQKLQQLKALPEPYRSTTVADSTSLRGAWAASYEVANIEPGLQGLLELSPHTEGVAMTLVSGQLSGGPSRDDSRQRLNIAHQKRAQMAGALGRFVPASQSGHAIPLTEPGLIAQEINGLL